MNDNNMTTVNNNNDTDTDLSILFVDGLVDQMKERFHHLGTSMIQRIDAMDKGIDSLESSIDTVVTQAGLNRSDMLVAQQQQQVDSTAASTAPMNASEQFVTSSTSERKHPRTTAAIASVSSISPIQDDDSSSLVPVLTVAQTTTPITKHSTMEQHVTPNSVEI